MASHTRPSRSWNSVFPLLQPHKAASTTRTLGPGWQCFLRSPRQPEGCFGNRVRHHQRRASSCSLHTPEGELCGLASAHQAARSRGVTSTRKPTIVPGHELPMSRLGILSPHPTRRSDLVSEPRPHSSGFGQASSVSHHPKAMFATRQEAHSATNHLTEVSRSEALSASAYEST
jgi:hypothetical protein